MLTRIDYIVIEVFFFSCKPGLFYSFTKFVYIEVGLNLLTVIKTYKAKM